MMKKNLVVALFIIVLSLSGNINLRAQTDSNSSDLVLRSRSKKEVAGQAKKTNTVFSASALSDEVFETNILLNNKSINVRVGYGKKAGEISIVGRDINTQEIITFSSDELSTLQSDLQSVLKSQIGTTDVEKHLLRSFNLLASWPALLPVIADPSRVVVPAECHLTYPDGISDNLCKQVNKQHKGRYATEGTYCGWAAYNPPLFPTTPILKLDEPTAWMEDVEHKVGGDGCFGRCGKGCIGDGEPNTSVNIYSQNCFDHDLCALNEGTLDAECNWMFMSAIDDFFYGPTCPALDLTFVIDTTGSMWDDIASVKSAATEIVNSLDSQISDYRVGVVSYRDFPVLPYGGSGDYPYRAILPFSTDRTSIINAIQGLTLGWGADWQESVYSALMRSLATEDLGAYRSGVKKAIILMGDAPAHNPEPFTWYTPLDVALAAFLVDPAIIYTIPIGGLSDTYDSFSTLSELTGGKTISAPTTNDVVKALLETIGSAAEPMNNAPICSGAVADKTEIWPPTHQMVPIMIQNLRDPDGDPISVTVTGIVQNEPVLGSGSGDKSPDGSGVGSDTAYIRAERSGKGNCRVYKISFSASDDKGASCSGFVLVGVPHDAGVNTVCVDSETTFDSTSH